LNFKHREKVDSILVDCLSIIPEERRIKFNEEAMENRVLNYDHWKEQEGEEEGLEREEQAYTLRARGGRDGFWRNKRAKNARKAIRRSE